MNKRILGGLAAVAALSLALVGCARADAPQNNTNGGDTSSSTGASTGASQLDITANAINPKGYDELGQGGTLRLGINAYPANWNTFTNDGNERNTINMSYAFYPSLLYYTASGDIQPNPNYTKSLELTSQDPQTIDVKLVPGLTWSDGTPLDWKSIKNTVDAANNQDFDVPSREGFDKVDSVKQGADQYEAIITLKPGEVYADWQGLVGATPDALVASADMFNKGWEAKPLVTAGPYKIDSLDPTLKIVTLVPDPNWKGEHKALLDKIIFTTYEDSSAETTAFKDGQLDVIEAANSQVWSSVKSDVDSGKYELREAAGPNWTHITLNGQDGAILSDQNLRQAFLYAVDRKTIFKALNGTMPYPAGTEDHLLGNHMLVSNQEGYVDNHGDYGTADVEKAKALIEKSGWTMGSDGYYTKDGKTLEIRYVYNEGSKVNGTVAPIVTENLKAVGIKLNVQTVPPTDLFAKYVNVGDYDITLFGWGGNPFLSSGSAIWKSDGEQNFSFVGSPELDKIIAEQQQTLDRKKSTDLLNQADKLEWDVAANLPLYQEYNFYVSDPDLANYGAPGFESIIDWTKVGFVKGADNLNG